MMTSFTVELGEEVVRTLQTQAAQRHTSVESLIASAVAEWASDESGEAGEAAQVEAGLRDMEAGRVHSQADASAEVRAHFGW